MMAQVRENKSNLIYLLYRKKGENDGKDENAE